MASRVEQLLTVAASELGKPYTYGAEGPATFDCSGLVAFVFAAVGLRLPRTAAEQQQATTPVARPQPGDLVFYGSPAHHVGIYVGGGRMIDAPHTGDVVKVQTVYDGATYGRVPGSGAGTAGLFDVIPASASSTAPAAGGITDRVRALIIEAAFVVAGIGAVGYGLYRALSPRRTT